jgi:hypothetical protein
MRPGVLALALWLIGSAPAPAQDHPYGYGSWDADSLGNHRVLLRVERPDPAVLASIPWRRHDARPESKRMILVDSSSGREIYNMAVLSSARERGEIVFEPVSGPGIYYLYYLPSVGTKRSSYPRITYPEPRATAASDWLTRHGIAPAPDARWSSPSAPRATVVGFQAIDTLNGFWPMQVIATRAETEQLLAEHPGRAFLVFPEERRYPVVMKRDLPQRWILRGPGGPFRASVERGEFFVFQIGLFAARGPARDVRIGFHDLRSEGSDRALPASAFRCFTLGGVDNAGREFTLPVTVDSGAVHPFWCGVQVPEGLAPGGYRGWIDLEIRGGERVSFVIELRVTPERLPAAGDDDPGRLARLRWLDSRLAFDDSIVAPYSPVRISGLSMRILGRTVTLGETGLPRSIRTFFTDEMTGTGEVPREILRSPIALLLSRPDGSPVRLRHRGVRFTRRAEGVAEWEARAESDPFLVLLRGSLEFDGTMEYRVALRASRDVPLGDVRLEIPMAADVARYMLGLGRRGGLRPGTLRWTWDVAKNQDGAWLGDVNAGLQFSLKDERYARPLNTNFYQLKPLVMPASWSNGGRGSIALREEGKTMRVVCAGGPRLLRAGEELRFDFRLVVTPFHPLNTSAQWSTRYYHRYRVLEEIAATGANTVNVHHATPINPYINYPFFRPGEMKSYVDSAHARGMKVKIYYTVRELANRAPELQALRSFGHEIFAGGPGGGIAWLQEHLVDDYIAGWYVPELKDAAVVTSGVSRWHNFYVEGLDWLARNVGIDGLYLDDVAFDRLTMKRVRKVLHRRRPGSLIDLHSANQFNVRDGFANSANLYLEHFPYVDRLWFGEYFEYDRPPEYWLTEVSGIPFGLMGEMLEGGGNPWRGMLYGMTSRLPWAGDPRPVWELQDRFGIKESRMVGYWAKSAPVRTGSDSVLATVYIRPERILIALASWSSSAERISLEIDWKALGLDPTGSRLSMPDVGDLQAGSSSGVHAPVTIEPGKGAWLILEGGGAK